MVGARSAVFALYPSGTDYHDEEHEQSYRQEDMPRYHARDVALWRASGMGPLWFWAAPLHLWSLLTWPKRSLPSAGAPERIETRPLPPAEIVDMRAELKHGNRSMLSRRLRLAISQRLQKREQMIILLNRRGWLRPVFSAGSAGMSCSVRTVGSHSHTMNLTEASGTMLAGCLAEISVQNTAVSCCGALVWEPKGWRGSPALEFPGPECSG